jgi:hypothetical protein
VQVHFKAFRSTFQSWNQLFEDAAEFSSAIGPDRLISISHSADDSRGVVTVWYWAEETAERETEARPD